MLFLNKWFKSLTGFPYPWLKGHRLAACSDREPGLVCRGMACFPVSPAGGGIIRKGRAAKQAGPGGEGTGDGAHGPGHQHNLEERKPFSR